MNIENLDLESQTKGMIHDLRKSVNKFFLKSNSIDRLMTDKVEDYIIIKEQPLPIKIGKYSILIGLFCLKTQREFFKQWSMIVSLLSARLLSMDLITERKKELIDNSNFHLLANGKFLYQFLVMDNWFEKQLYKLIKKTILTSQQYFYNDIINKVELKQWDNKLSYNYFIENCDMEKLMQICYLIYLYNFDSVKKNLSFLVVKMGLQQQTETYMYFWLQNLAGTSGEFLTSLAPSADYIFSVGEKKLNMQPGRQTKKVETKESK